MPRSRYPVKRSRVLETAVEYLIHGLGSNACAAMAKSSGQGSKIDACVHRKLSFVR